MASAQSFREGMSVTINSGVMKGYFATILDPAVVPDGQPEQRKVKCNVTFPDGGEWTEYILPRLLELGHVKINESMVQDIAAIEAGLTSDQLAGIQPNQMAMAPVTMVTRAKPITDPMDPALDRFRPSRHVVDLYVSRNVPGGLTDIDYMLKLRDQRDSRGFSPNVALVGDTQSGKTMLVQVLACLAADRDGMPKPYPVFTLSGSSGITSYDLFGQTTAVEVNGREQLVWMEGLVPMALHCGGFLYLDEWNAVPPSQAVSVHPVLDDRRQFVNYQRAIPSGHGGWAPEVVDAKSTLWCLSTINPGYKGTQTMAEATSNRFRWVPWDYDKDTEKSLVPSVTIRTIGDELRNLRVQRVVTLPVGTSALQRFNHDCVTFGVENALWVFQGMFPPNERERVITMIEDRGFKDMLQAEYPSVGVVTATDDDDD